MTAAPLDRLAQRMNLAARQRRAPVAFVAPTAPPALPPERLAYSVAEAAAALGCCSKTLKNWSIPTVKIGGRRLILADDLREFLRQHREIAP